MTVFVLTGTDMHDSLVLVFSSRRAAEQTAIKLCVSGDHRVHRSGGCMMALTVDIDATLPVPEGLRGCTTNDIAREMTREHVLPVIRQAHDAAVVALDAWLERPLDCSCEWAMYAMFVSREHQHQRFVTREQQETSIRTLIEILLDASKGDFFDDWGVARQRWLDGVRKIALQGTRSIDGGPRGFLNAIYAEFRDGIAWHGLSAPFGVSSRGPLSRGVKREPNGSLRRPWLQNTLGVLASPALADALIELDRCMREAHVQAARVRAALSTLRATPYQARFLRWMLEHGKPVRNKDVRDWVAGERGLTLPVKWGAQDPAGPLLRRYCRKLGMPGTQTAWVLRDEVIATAVCEQLVRRG